MLSFQFRLRGITVNKARVQEDVQESHLVNCQLIIKFIQFPGNKRNTLFLRPLKSLPHTLVKICSPVFVYTLTLLVTRYPAKEMTKATIKRRHTAYLLTMWSYGHGPSHLIVGTDPNVLH